MLRFLIGPLVFLTIILQGIWVTPSHAATINATACNGSADHSKVQAAVDSAINNDIVQIQGTACTFTGTVSWTNKAITVRGNGIASTIITSNNQSAFYVTATTSTGVGVRLTGFRINANNLDSTGAIELDGRGLSGQVAGRFRVDNVFINLTLGVSPRGFFIYGPIYGLIDHIRVDYDATSVANGVSVHGQMNLDTNYGGSLQNGSYACNNFPIGLGDDKAVYVEDSEFNYAWGTGNSGGINDLEYCARMVFRHNQVTGSWHLQTHATRGTDRGGIRSEYYNNVFDGNNDSNYVGMMDMRSGTGVVFNNQFKNVICWWCTGNKAIILDMQRVPGSGGCLVNDPPLNTITGSNAADGNIEANGWPGLDQPGFVGPQGSQTNVPIYIWNNGAQAGCATGGACNGDWNGVFINCEGLGSAGARMEDFIKTTAHSNGAKDFCSGTTSMPASCGTHTNTYSAYTYPHPLQSAGSSNPATRLNGSVGITGGARL